MKRYWKLYTLGLCLAILFSFDITVSALEHHATGLEVMSKTEEEAFRESMLEVIGVRLNEDALKRLEKSGEIQNKDMLDKIEAVEKGTEIITNQSSMWYAAKNLVLQADIEEVINSISSYDGSKSVHFPLIENQGTSGSCTSWSMGYYQLTNNIANVRNLDAHNHLGSQISAYWIHNLCKSWESLNGGSSEVAVMSLLKKQGAPYNNTMSWLTNDENFKSWNPKMEAWEQALGNRVEICSLCSILNETTNQIDLTKLKSILYNGYVVSFSSWYYGDLDSYIHNDKIISPSSKKNDGILTLMRGYGDNAYNNGHEMTIVGWDDTIEIDSNGDGVVDSKGALKIANSWGEAWGNDGFFWIAYDALKPQANMKEKELNRVPAIYECMTYFMMPKRSYTPLLLAEVTLETNSRRELGVELGITTTDKDVTSNYKHIYNNTFEVENDTGYYCLRYKNPFYFKGYMDKSEAYQAVNYDFYGNELPQNQRTKATFVFDLTDTVMELYKESVDSINETVRFYFRIEDIIKDGYSSALKKVRIVDKMTNVSKTVDTDIIVDGTKGTFFVDYDIIPKIVNPDKDFTLSFNYPIQSDTINNYLQIKKDGFSNCSVGITSSIDGQKIYIEHPDGGYQMGHPYAIDMSGLRSSGGNALSSQNIFWFYVP